MHSKGVNYFSAFITSNKMLMFFYSGAVKLIKLGGQVFECI